MGYRQIIIYTHNWSNMTLKKLPTVGTRLTHSWVKWVTKPIFGVGPTFASILSVNLIFAYIVERYAYCLYMHLCSVITVHWEVTRECRMLPAVSALALFSSFRFLAELLSPTLLFKWKYFLGSLMISHKIWDWLKVWSYDLKLGFWRFWAEWTNLCRSDEER